MSLVILCSLIVLISSYLYWINRTAGKMMKSVRLLPGTHPVVGYITLLSVIWKGKRGVTGWLEKLLSLQEDHRSSLLGAQLFAAVEPDTITAILSSSDALNKPIYYSFVSLSEGSALTCLSAKRWKGLRTKLNDTFKTDLFEGYIQVMNVKAKLCVKVLKEMETKTFDVHELMTRYMWDIVTVTHFGVDENQQVAQRKIFPGVSNTLKELIIQRILSFWLHFSFTFNKSNLKKKIDSLVHERMEESTNVVKQSLEDYEAKVKESDDNNIWKPYSQHFKEYLTLNLKTEDNSILSDLDRITLGVNDLLNSGTDTSAVVVSHLLYNLGAYPEYQEKVYKEVEDLWTGADWTSQQLSRMPYLGMAIQEALRHTSPCMVFRQATNDIDIGKCTIPEETTIICFLKNSQMDERYFEQPAKFNPDNFLPERVQQRPKGASLPFSFGPRDCPGKDFALLAMKCVVSEIVRNFQIASSLEPAAESKRVCSTTGNTTGYPIRLTPRNQLHE